MRQVYTLLASESAAGRDARCAESLRELAGHCGSGAVRFAVRFCGSYGGLVELVDAACRPMMRVPRWTLIGWKNRGWVVESAHQTRHGLMWVLTDEGEGAIQ